MSKRAKFLYILLAVFVVFWMSYGLYEPFRIGVNDWILNVGGPTASKAWTDFTTGVTSNPVYQQWHPIPWIFATGILAYAVHQIHAANKVPGFRVSPTQTSKSDTFQREPTEPEVAPAPAKEQPPQIQEPTT